MSSKFQHCLKRWIEKSEALKTELCHWETAAVSLGELSASPTDWQGARIQETEPLLAASVPHGYQKGDHFIVIFPETVVGRLHFKVIAENGYGDSPTWLRMRFAELPGELKHWDDPFTGILNCAWLQEDTIHIDNLPADVTLPRRYSCRYVEFEVLGSPGKVQIFDIGMTMEAAVQDIPVLPWVSSSLDASIERMCLRTIRNCFQTCPEDGAKRDRRLWGGDLRIANLLNHCSFKRYDLIERGLFLLAGNAMDDKLPGCVFERPTPRPGCLLHDYSLLFSVILEEYCRLTGKYEIGSELFDIAAEQFLLIQQYFHNDLFKMPSNNSWDFFIDHCRVLEKEAAFQGLAVFSLQALLRLGEALGIQESRLSSFRQLKERWLNAGRVAFYNAEKGLVICNGQVSYASQIWFVLGGLLTEEEGSRALKTIEGIDDAVKPKTPYLAFSLLEAYEKCGDTKAIHAFIQNYWGGMIAKGADTCWEAYVPDDPFFSPYDDFRLNSACHVWSAGAIWFLRNKGAVAKNNYVSAEAALTQVEQLVE